MNPSRYVVPAQAWYVYLSWAFTALFARSAIKVAILARYGVPRSHPAHKYIQGTIPRADTVREALYTGLPTWAIQVARFTVILLAIAATYWLWWGDAADLGLDKLDPLGRPHPRFPNYP